MPGQVSILGLFNKQIWESMVYLRINDELEFIRKVDKIHENQNTIVYCVFNHNRTSHDADLCVFLGLEHVPEGCVSEGVWFV